MENPIIVALDGMNEKDILEIAKLLSETNPTFKVNDALDGKNGPGILSKLGRHGKPFADTKYFDIPQTMANRVAKIRDAGAKMITIHGSNTIEAMKTAVENRGNALILAVTVLTSMNEEDCQESYGRSVNAAVLHFARNALSAGVQGIVCSPKELNFLAQYSELNNLIKVTPGIRPAWYQKKDDQKRKMTPAEAIRAGADYLVMGRPILRAGIPPSEAMKKTLEEVAEARREMANS